MVSTRSLSRALYFSVTPCPAGFRGFSGMRKMDGVLVLRCSHIAVDHMWVLVFRVIFVLFQCGSVGEFDNGIKHLSARLVLYE